MSTRTTESVFAIRRLISAARARGLALDEGPSARDPAFYARVSVARAQQLRERAVRELGPATPLAVAAGIEEHHALIHFALMSCRTMAEVLHGTVRHWRYVTDAFPARAVRHGGAVHLQLDVPASPPLGVRVGVEYVLALIVRASLELTGGAWRPRSGSPIRARSAAPSSAGPARRRSSSGSAATHRSRSVRISGWPRRVPDSSRTVS